MRNYFNLVKIQFLSYFGINKLLHSKKRGKSMGFAGLLLVGLITGAALAYFGYTYADLFASMLSSEGRTAEIITIMLAISAMVCFFFAFYATSNVLFGFKDYDMLSAMPIKTNTVVTAKLTYMYLSDLIFMTLIAFPSLFVYAKYAGDIAFSTVLVTSLLVIVLPMFALALAIAVGAFVTLISARFRYKNIIQMILMFAFLIGVFALSFTAGSGAMSDVTGSISKIFFIYPLVAESLGNWGYFALTAAICIASFLLIVTAVCLLYGKINTLLVSRRTVKGFRLRKYGSQSMGKALLKKEIGRLFSVAMYAVNALIGSILSIVAAVAIVVVFRSVPEAGQEAGAVMAVFMPSLFAFLHMLAPTTSCSISLEGSSLWILKTVPVRLNSLFGAKLTVNAVFNAVPALASALVLTIGLGMPAAETIFLIIIAVGVALLGGNIGLLFDLRFPTLKWENETKPVKQGVALLLSMACAFVLTAAFFLMMFYINLSFAALLAIIAGTVVVLTAATFVLVFTEGKKLFDRIS